MRETCALSKLHVHSTSRNAACYWLFTVYHNIHHSATKRESDSTVEHDACICILYALRLIRKTKGWRVHLRGVHDVVSFKQTVTGGEHQRRDCFRMWEWAATRNFTNERRRTCFFFPLTVELSLAGAIRTSQAFNSHGGQVTRHSHNTAHTTSQGPRLTTQHNKEKHDRKKTRHSQYRDRKAPEKCSKIAMTTHDVIGVEERTTYVVDTSRTWRIPTMVHWPRPGN